MSTSIKAFAGRAALAVALGVAALIGGTGAASASDFQTQYWSDHCDYGRACVHHVNGSVWNVEHCGVTGLDDYYRHASAHGNPFTVFYKDGSSVYVAAWTNRTIPAKLASGVQVYC
ncbi:hypothetical protein ABZX92_15600 [Lentzea sp. NPDC006480]|uniref:hypothetical protein n=1 Tax=Lentzea sp. NPDC006480 TaxID=3157176 RepID=UPI0033B5F280